MKNLMNQRLLTSLAQAAYVMNAIGGGMSPQRSSFQKFRDHYLLKIRVPGLHPDHYSVEIVEEQLYIYQLMELEKRLVVPYLLQHRPIPDGVDFQQITARYQKGFLHIHMPLRELTGGYFRTLEIQKR
ncbi:MAG: Hsp20/alpha crystallin family protein [Cyclobacteriaceae bacterium]|nr:Hsp20/alpha crystallin family protein [Cyclobacteriaceae bacterium]